MTYIKTLHDVMPDSEVPNFFKRATCRKYTNNESAINDIRRMLRLFYNEKCLQQINITNKKAN